MCVILKCHVFRSQQQETNADRMSNYAQALHEACAHGQRETVEQLLRLGVDGHKTALLGGETPLHFAVQSGNWSLVSLLLQHGFDPNIPNNYGATCFHYAGWKPAIVKLLLRFVNLGHAPRVLFDAASRQKQWFENDYTSRAVHEQYLTACQFSYKATTLFVFH